MEILWNFEAFVTCILSFCRPSKSTFLTSKNLAVSHRNNVSGGSPHHGRHYRSLSGGGSFHYSQSMSKLGSLDKKKNGSNVVRSLLVGPSIRCGNQLLYVSLVYIMVRWQHMYELP